ncbi:Clp protease N-terminal domain-containing protein [Streptomyces mayonensis]|uniref:Clp protease N-terminal domain-containing protein n=1 Tax=Streptomyces mayonensis TaxID=2750816 RepID=UPI001C1E5F1E|nr:Clp protease N-terminal domain-containing protein [Streptomyces sp. A108]MBU6530921.1 Clp protease N-terminal domain-containing protein [Streptomyces sp. A108]
MNERKPDHHAGATTEFERDVYKLLLETVRTVAKQERADIGTESLLSALVSDDWAAGSAIAPGMRKAGSLGGSIGVRGTSVWVSGDTANGITGTPEDDRDIDALWREVWHDEVKRRRWKNRKKTEEEQLSLELPPITGALRACLHKALDIAREEGSISVHVRHVARALVDLPDTRAREAMVVEKLGVSAAATALDELRGNDEVPEPTSVLLLRKTGTFGKSGNPLSRKFFAWIFGGGAGFGSAMIGAVRSEEQRSAVRRGAAESAPVDVLMAMLALDRSLTVAQRELPENLRAENRGAELLHRHGARQDTLARVLLPTTGLADGAPPEVGSDNEFARRLLHVTALTASAHGAPTVGTTHLLAALLDESGTDAESVAEIERVLTECGADVAALRAEPELRAPNGSSRAA